MALISLVACCFMVCAGSTSRTTVPQIWLAVERNPAARMTPGTWDIPVFRPLSSSPTSSSTLPAPSLSGPCSPKKSDFSAASRRCCTAGRRLRFCTSSTYHDQPGSSDDCGCDGDFPFLPLFRASLSARAFLLAVISRPCLSSITSRSISQRPSPSRHSISSS